MSVRATPGTLSRSALVRWGFLLVLGTILCGGVLGWVAASGWDLPSRNGFAWEVSAVGATAFATAALAAFTGALAWTTSGDVRATWELVRQAEDDRRRADTAQVIVQSTRDWSGSWDGGNVGATLRNIGFGQALGIELRLEYEGSLKSPTSERQYLASLAPGETVELTLSVRFPEASSQVPGGNNVFRVLGTYRDRTDRGTLVVENPHEADRTE